MGGSWTQKLPHAHGPGIHYRVPRPHRAWIMTEVWETSTRLTLAAIRYGTEDLKIVDEKLSCRIVRRKLTRRCAIDCRWPYLIFYLTKLNVLSKSYWTKSSTPLDSKRSGDIGFTEDLFFHVFIIQKSYRYVCFDILFDTATSSILSSWYPILSVCQIFQYYFQT